MADDKAENGLVMSENRVPKPPKEILSCRLILVLMGCFGFFNIYCLRVNLSVALVAMVNSTYMELIQLAEKQELLDSNVTIIHETSCEVEENTTKKIVETGEFEWNTNQQGVILAGFFYGYITTQIAGGILSQRFGGKLLLLFGIFWTSLLTLFTPPLTKAGGFAAIVAVRVLEGIGEGVTYPATYSLLACWCPPLERSKMTTTVFAGAQVGTVVAMAASGVLCEYVNWDSVFYVFGALGVLWSIMWLFLVYDSPSRHPRISAEERDYIETAIGSKSDKRSAKLPLKDMVKSLPIYAIMVSHFCFNWGYYTLLTCLPMFLKHILHFDIKSNGFLSAVPYLAMWAMLMIAGVVADQLRSKNIMSTTLVRKLITVIGFLAPAIALIATGYVECNAALAVSLIVIGIGFSGVCFAGWACNHLDIAPPYAGTLMGFTNMIATIPGFVGPSVVGAFTYRNQTRAAWRKVFYVTAAIYVFGTIFYCIFGSGERQYWAYTDDERKQMNEKKAQQEKSKPLLADEKEAKL